MAELYEWRVIYTTQLLPQGAKSSAAVVERQGRTAAIREEYNGICWRWCIIEIEVNVSSCSVSVPGVTRSKLRKYGE